MALGAPLVLLLLLEVMGHWVDQVRLDPYRLPAVMVVVVVDIVGSLEVLLVLVPDSCR